MKTVSNQVERPEKVYSHGDGKRRLLEVKLEFSKMLDRLFSGENVYPHKLEIVRDELVDKLRNSQKRDDR